MRIDAEICQTRMSVEPSAIGIANRITHFTDVDCYIFFIAMKEERHGQILGLQKTNWSGEKTVTQ